MKRWGFIAFQSPPWRGQINHGAELANQASTIKPRVFKSHDWHTEVQTRMHRFSRHTRTILGAADSDTAADDYGDGCDNDDGDDDDRDDGYDGDADVAAVEEERDDVTIVLQTLMMMSCDPPKQPRTTT